MSARRKIQPGDIWEAATVPTRIASPARWRQMHSPNVAASWAHATLNSRLSPRSRSSYIRHLDYWVDWLEQVNVHILDATHVEVAAYADWCRHDRRIVDKRDGCTYHSTLGPSTIKTALAAIRHFYRWMELRVPDLRDPTAKVERPRIKHVKGDVLSGEDLAAMLHDMGGSPRERIQCWMLGYTGMRVQELCDLRWDQVDMRNSVLYVEGKGDKHRVVDILPELHAEIESWRAIQLEASYSNDALSAALRHPQTSRFILTRGGKPVPTTTVWRALKARAARAGVRAFPEQRQQRKRTDGGRLSKLVDMRSEVTPHMLRRTFATILLERGVPLDAVSDILGHEDTSTTRRFYTSPSSDRRKQAMRKFKL